MKKDASFIEGRGAQTNPTNRFESLIYEDDVEILSLKESSPLLTNYINVYPKTILNKVPGEDIPLDYSMNPYQGCEHGCIYCYARNTHPYWGYSAGLDFETKIMVKANAAKLLEKKLSSKRWKAAPVMLSGNTDCYQPVERKLKITRSILQVFWKYRHPVGIITKNSLILRDLDIIKKLAGENLVRVVMCITSLDEEIRKLLEPRTSTIKLRLKAVKELSKSGIPVSVMMGPIIPGINDHEILPLAEQASASGASDFSYITVRLNGEVGAIFEDWIRKALPDKADKVLSQIRALHGGKLNDSRTGIRMRGEGSFSDIIRQQYDLAKQKYFANSKPKVSYNLDLYEEFKNPQLKLF